MNQTKETYDESWSVEVKISLRDAGRHQINHRFKLFRLFMHVWCRLLRWWNMLTIFPRDGRRDDVPTKFTSDKIQHHPRQKCVWNSVAIGSSYRFCFVDISRLDLWPRASLNASERLCQMWGFLKAFPSRCADRNATDDVKHVKGLTRRANACFQLTACV